MYHRGCQRDFHGFNMTERTINILRDDLPLPDDDAQIAQQVWSFRLWRGTEFWLELLRAIAQGSAPRVSANGFCEISANSQTKLEDIMGCEKWVVLELANIAAGHAMGSLEHKTNEESTLFGTKLTDAALADSPTSRRQAASANLSMSITTSSHASSAITQAFACMAIIYLHIVTLGFSKLDALDSVITQMLSIIRRGPCKDYLSVLVCPIFFIGLVADVEDQHYFRDLFSSHPVLHPALKHRQGILPILETVWSRRQHNELLLWKDMVDLIRGILLI
jgi:C6 transcription factor Pro1